MADSLERLTTALADRYRIERELGAGGMATVYLADDLKHNRKVALKVLRPELAFEVGVQRFAREIALAASLNHPHILPLFDSGEAGGLLYFVMPVMEGESLRDRLIRERQLPVDEAVKIACEVAGALEYAHKQDVVHRDIKPENVMLHDGHAVVADFGIGKVIAGAADHVTQTGATVGTPAYMSPEQASGETAIDGRSDLYSLGCMLYEMLSGEPPFTGPTAQAIIAKRFTQTPPNVTAVRSTVPQGVSRAVSKLLGRTPADRYATASEFVSAITGGSSDPSATAQAVDHTSIAVLPFSSLSTDPDDEFFADGITEEILNALAQIPDMRVAARSSAFSFKGRNEDLRSVAAKLNVATVLEGTIRRSGERLRVTAQLINAADGYQLWSERYDRVLQDVFDVQDEIANAIATRLRVSLRVDSDSPLVRPHTQHLPAYELYLKGRALLYQRGASIPKASDCFREAVALDPEYAQAWAGLADAYTTAGYSGFAPASQVMPKALDAARRSLALDPQLAEAHNALACAALLYEWDYELAEREFRRALELNPQYIQASAWYGLFYLQWVVGRRQEAREELQRMYELDPLSSYANVIAACSAFTDGRAAEAVEFARRGAELDPESFLALWSLTQAFHYSGEYEKAVEVVDKVSLMSENSHIWMLATMVQVYADWNDPERAQALYKDLEARSAREYVQPSMAAPAAAAVGDMDAALDHARRAVGEKDPIFVLLVRTFPTYARLRAEPRFREIISELHLPADIDEMATG